MSGTVLAGRLGTESKFIGMLAPRRWRGLVGVLAAQAGAWTGTRVSAIAIPWFVLVATGSVVQTGLIVFVEMFPYVIFQVLSGPIVDRIGARRISIIGDVVSMGVVAVIPLLFSLNILHVWLLLPFVAVIGAFRGPSDAAKAILIPVVTDVAQLPL